MDAYDREMLLRAFMQETGLQPSEIIMFEKPGKKGMACWFEQKTGNEVMAGWERLADQSARIAALEAALVKAEEALQRETRCTCEHEFRRNDFGVEVEVVDECHSCRALAAIRAARQDAERGGDDGQMP